MLTLPTAVLAWPGLVGIGSEAPPPGLCSAICRGNQRRLQLCMHTHVRSCPSYLSRISYLLQRLRQPSSSAPSSSFSLPLPLQSSLNTQTHTHTLGARSNEFQAPRGHMLCSLRDGESFPQLSSCSSSCSVLSSWLRLPRCIHS